MTAEITFVDTNILLYAHDRTAGRKHELARTLVALCSMFEPVAPSKMVELAGFLGLGGVPTLAAARTLGMSGRTVTKGTPLFPRVDPSWARTD